MIHSVKITLHYFFSGYLFMFGLIFKLFIGFALADWFLNVNVFDYILIIDKLSAPIKANLKNIYLAP